MEPLTSVDAIRLTLRKAVENGRFSLARGAAPAPSSEERQTRPQDLP